MFDYLSARETERLDLSDEFWVKFHVHIPKLKNQVGLRKFESIVN